MNTNARKHGTNDVLYMGSFSYTRVYISHFYKMKPSFKQKKKMQGRWFVGSGNTPLL